MKALASSHAQSGGWDGWISLSGSQYGVTYNSTTGKFAGYAWGSLNVGWVSFAFAQTCSSMQHWDTTQNKCVDNDITCPVGQHWDTTQNKCVPDNCPTGQHWDATQNKCVPDNCPTGQHWDATQNKCVPDNCPVGQHWDATQNKCVPDNCPVGQHWDATQNKCVPDNCPTGQHWDATQNKCVPDNCPVDYHWDATQNKCVPDTSTCPPGEHMDLMLNVCVNDNTTTTITLTTSSSSIQWGTKVTITWDAIGATSCTGTNFITGSDPTGSVTTGPIYQTTTYTLTCDTGTKTVTVVVPSCPAGWSGTPPVCSYNGSVCPVGYVGTPPSCAVASTCPIGYTGTPPNCVSDGTQQCVPTNVCSGLDVIDSCTSGLIQRCQYQCLAGTCVIPSPQIVSWNVAPKLVKIGNPTNITWQAQYVSSCSVTGTNGDSWSGFSGQQVSSGITTQTTFTFTCYPLPGSNGSSVSSSSVVNIVPVFQEQ